jgi:mannobiose 2-epimerase
VIASDDAFLRRVALDMVDAACEGLAPDGSLYYEYEPAHDHWRREKHWWVQAEAMVGLVNAWQISKDEVYLDRFDRIWAYTVAHIIDQTGGEWVWGRHEDNRLMEGEDKAGLWKCPYHNSRALLEVIRRKSA